MQHHDSCEMAKKPRKDSPGQCHIPRQAAREAPIWLAQVNWKVNH